MDSDVESLLKQGAFAPLFNREITWSSNSRRWGMAPNLTYIPDPLLLVNTSLVSSWTDWNTVLPLLKQNACLAQDYDDCCMLEALLMVGLYIAHHGGHHSESGDNINCLPAKAVEEIRKGV